MENQSENQKSEKLLLFILAAINFTHIMDFVIMMPMNPVLQSVLHINNKQFSLLVAAYAASAGIFGFLGSFYIDRFDRKTALLALYTGFIISTLGCALAQSYSLFLVARFMAGAFGGILGALVLAVIGDAIPEERRGKATGFVMAAFSAASIAGIPLGYFLAVKINWHMPFFLITAISLVVLVVAWKTFPSLRSHISMDIKQNPFALIKHIFGNSNLLWALLFTFVLMIAGLTVIPFISDYMVKNVGFEKDQIAYIYLFGGLATFYSSPAIGRLADLHGKRKVFVIMALISIIPILLVTNLPQVPKYVAFLVTTSFFIAFGGRFVPAMAMITSSVERKQRGGFMSFNSSVQQLSSALSSMCGGLIISTTLDDKVSGFWKLGLIATIATILCVLISMKVKQVE
ncbi:MFS transporter [Sporocytophaga myxococcoides]|uniref:MFS transporter n=1 Tax=Sporocytophaga myxococcoides TaxID=153721 RepID=UPI000426BBC9|nr:MFS transporter [Sporocytophaga myxococcoides]